MDWRQRLKSIVENDPLRGKIKLKLLQATAEFRDELFDDNDDSVRASLLALIEPAAAASQVTPEQDDRLYKQMGELSRQMAGLEIAWKTNMVSEKSIRISDADSNVWRNVQSLAGFELEHVRDLFDATKHKERAVAQFVWDTRGERAQAERYVSHVKELLELGENWLVIDGNKYPKLLDYNLGGRQFKGTTDVAVVDNVAYSLPVTGLKIVFELKKGVSKINERVEWQTIVSVVLANAVCKRMRPVAMLSDLVDKWIFFWVDGLSVFRREFDTRGKAVGFLDAILEGDVEPDAIDQSHDIAALSRTGERSSRGVKRSFSGRKIFWPPEMERLEELAGFLPEDELRRDRAAIALQYALNMPAFNCVLRYA